MMRFLTDNAPRRLGLRAIGASAIALVLLSSNGAFAAGGGGAATERQSWSFAGVTGQYDQAQLQRGYKIYKEACSVCHSMRLVSFRNLGQVDGPSFSEAAVAALASEVEVTDGPNEDGEMFQRPGKAADRFPRPFPNEQAARAANGGAYPPDLSVMAKARNANDPWPWFLEPVKWARDIVTGYQEGGPDYIYALLTGYHDAPADVEIAEGMHYNAAFDGFQIAMAAPLSADQVEYTDGTPQTVSQYSRDVAAFLMWAAEPTLGERKRLGLRVLFYLLITSLVLYLAKRTLWSRLH